jgi:hypothetical protein
VPPGDVDSGSKIGEPTDAGADAGAGRDAGGRDAGSLGECRPNNDGVITAAEMPVAAGLVVRSTFLTSGQTPFAGQGEMVGGVRQWDLSGDLPGDHPFVLEVRPLEGMWFASKFPNATFYMRLQEQQELLGVFEATDDGLLMLGAVSPTDGLLRTELTYDPPAKVIVYPLAVGKSWSSTSTASGVTDGVLTSVVQTLSVKVDLEGDIKTPLGTFHALRVNSSTTSFPAPPSTHSFAFVSECLGTVALVSSQLANSGTSSPPPQKCGGSLIEVREPLRACGEPGRAPRSSRVSGVSRRRASR